MDDFANHDVPQPADDSQWPTPLDYVDQATHAAKQNHKRLAIHLFIAAFELENVSSMMPSTPVLEGMHRAWDLAVEAQDKSSAEVLFAELAPYSSPEQTKRRVRQLQDMAVTQLKEMGVPEERIERMHIIHSPEATRAGADPDFATKFRDVLRNDSTVDEVLENDLNMPNVPDTRPGKGSMPPVMPQWGRDHDESAFESSRYEDLVGYDDALKAMRVYGFEAAGDEEYRQFIQEASEFHGLEGLSLYDPFLFWGPSRDDVYEFAEATAGEIGNPVVTLHVRTDDEGMWTIRLSGPFRRGLFGVSDPIDVPTPCTFIIENLDILQDFIRASIRGEMMNPDAEDHNLHAYNEILGYIHAMLQKPDVFPILTAQSNLKLSPQFDEVFDRAQRIQIAKPTLEERRAIWADFAADHASFQSIDIDELSQLSNGISRHDMITAGQAAVRDAYQNSLTSNTSRSVDIKDVLFEMVPFIPQDDLAYSTIEDAAAQAFVDELGDFTFEDEEGASQGDAPQEG